MNFKKSCEKITPCCVSIVERGKGVIFMKKRIIAMAAVLVFLLATTANAAVLVTKVTPSLTFSGTTANCSVTVRDSGKEIEATVELWYGNTLIDSWSDSGTSRLTVSGSHTVTKGRTYTMKVAVTVDGSNVNVSPISKTC